jgi:hypothetical protein
LEDLHEKYANILVFFSVPNELDQVTIMRKLVFFSNYPYDVGSASKGDVVSSRGTNDTQNTAVRENV